MSKVYLSSTFEDLKEYRDAVYRTLRQIRRDVVSMEDYVASGERPLDKCLADVAGCDAYVGLFAWRYGYVPPGEEYSITELELLEAERNGMPCLIFLLRDDAPWSPKLMDSDQSAIRALRARLQERFTVQFFRNVDELARAVATSTANLFERDETDEPSPADIGLYRNCVKRFAAELDHDIRFYALASAALIVLAVTGMVLAFAALEDQRQLLAAGGGMLFASSSPFPVATWRSIRKKKAVFDAYVDALGAERPAREAVVKVRRFLESQMAGARLA